ncbi:MAG: helix-turn-helix transcriptional regulator [Chitinophagaceae bacterium]
MSNNLTRLQLSHLLRTNPYTLKTTFRHLFDTSIGKYKRSVLMEHAQMLLETTDYSLDEISFRLGYSSQQSFAFAFKRYFGRTAGRSRRSGKL